MKISDFMEIKNKINSLKKIFQTFGWRSVLDIAISSLACLFISPIAEDASTVFESVYPNGHLIF